MKFQIKFVEDVSFKELKNILNVLEEEGYQMNFSHDWHYFYDSEKKRVAGK